MTLRLCPDLPARDRERTDAEQAPEQPDRHRPPATKATAPASSSIDIPSVSRWATIEEPDVNYVGPGVGVGVPQTLDGALARVPSPPPVSRQENPRRLVFSRTAGVIVARDEGADRVAGPVLGCGFDRREAAHSATSQRIILAATTETSVGAGLAAQAMPRPANVLSADDFGPDVSETDGRRVTAIGAISRQPYSVPADAVLTTDAGDSGASRRPRHARTAVAPTPASAVDAAVRDVVRVDAMQRWWSAGPQSQAGRLEPADDLVVGALPTAVVHGLMAERLRVRGFVLRGGLWAVALVVLTANSGINLALGSAISWESLPANDVVGLAFVRAMADYVVVGDLLAGRRAGAPWSWPVLERWFRGRDYLAELDRRCSPIRTPGRGHRPRAGSDWSDVALRRFGHEPVAFRLTAPDDRSVISVACPGAVTTGVAQPLSPLLAT